MKRAIKYKPRRHSENHKYLPFNYDIEAQRFPLLPYVTIRNTASLPNLGEKVGVVHLIHLKKRKKKKKERKKIQLQTGCLQCVIRPSELSSPCHKH